MKYYVLVLLFMTVRVSGQELDTGRRLNNDSLVYAGLSYDFAAQLPGLYRAARFDSIGHMIAHCEKTVGEMPVLVPYKLLVAIKARQFSEEISNVMREGGGDTSQPYSDSTFYRVSIVPYYLQWYRDNFDIGFSSGYPLNVRLVYRNYFSFIADLATDLQAVPHLGTAERWLLRYLAAPDDNLLYELDDSTYNGTLLQQSWQIKQQEQHDEPYLNTFLYAGAWVPRGAIAATGRHAYLGAGIGGRRRRLQCDANIDVRFLPSADRYGVKVDSVIYSTRYYIGLNMGVTGGYALLTRNAYETQVTAGAACELFGAFSSRTIKNYELPEQAGTFYALNLNVGLSQKFFFAHRQNESREYHRYVAIVPRYNFLFYNSRHTPDLRGGAWTISLVYGGFSRDMTHYHIDK